MLFWYDQRLPYPEEICVMFSEMTKLVNRYEVMDQMGFAEWDHKWMIDPINYHTALKGDKYQNLPKFKPKETPVPAKVYPKDQPIYTEEQAKSFAETNDYPYQWPEGGFCQCSSCTAAQEYRDNKVTKELQAKLDKINRDIRMAYPNFPTPNILQQPTPFLFPDTDLSSLNLTKPNPPRVARLQVKEVTQGQTTIHVLDYPLLYLKDAKDWKYDDTATINVRDIDALVDNLLAVKYRVQERRGGK